MGYLGVLVSVWLNIAADFIDRSVSQSGQAKNLAFWTNVIQFFLIVPLIGLVHPMPFDALIWCIVVGALTAFGRIPWFRALAVQGQSLSRLSPFVRLSSFFVLLGAIFILDEPFNEAKFGGGCLLIFASILALLDEPLQTIRQLFNKNKSSLYATLYALSNSAVPLLYKFLVNRGEDLFSIYFELKVFQALFIGMASAQGIVAIQRTTSFGTFKLIVFARILQTLAALVYLGALSGLALSVAEPIAALGPFFVLLVEFVLLMFGRTPTTYEVRWSRRRITTRVASAMLAAAGLLLMLR
jgi:drug/metabolite transporter (DMT)-like permease